jgi:osmotically-inducible protein OsmY
VGDDEFVRIPSSARAPGVYRGTVASGVSFLTDKESITMNLLKYFSAIFATVMLATALGCASTSKQEGTGEYMDDSLITTKVKAAVFNEPSLKSSEINVETFKGVVQLSGFVNSQADINKAVEVARSVKGVTSVKNDMRVK